MTTVDQQRFSLVGGEVHVWNVELDSQLGNLVRYQQFLSDDEVERASRFKFERDKVHYCISRGVLRVLCGKYLDISPLNVNYRYSRHGKPFIRESGLEFNVSHSNGIASIGLTVNYPIGVDVEFIKPAEAMPDSELRLIAGRFFSKPEFEKLVALPVSSLRRAFFECWTRKEAFIKAEGSGLSFPLDQFEVSFGDVGSAQLLSTKWDPSECEMWYLSAFEVGSSHVGAVSVRGEVRNMTSFTFDAKDFFVDARPE